MKPLTAEQLRARAGSGWRSPPQQDRLPSFEDVTGKVTEHEHVCGVGGEPRGGQSAIRRCRCGQFYLYGSWGWRKMSRVTLYRNRRLLDGLPDDFLDLADWGAGVSDVPCMGGPGRFRWWLSDMRWQAVRWLAGRLHPLD